MELKTFAYIKMNAGVLFAVLLLQPVSASARYMFQTHGNDYEYEINGDKFFPVVWDIRGAWMNYFGYAMYYRELEPEQAFSYADEELHGVLLQAKNAGVNSVIIRGSMVNDVRSGTDAYFSGRADMLREMGLNIIPGGFGNILNQTVFNEDMKAHIESYLAQPVPPDYAPVVGVHGFNEPDGLYDASGSNDRNKITARLSSFHTWSNSLGLPLSSFMAKPAVYVPYLANPNTGQDSTICKLCSHLDFPILDWYPCKTFTKSCTASVPEADVLGATDLIPTDASSNHYYAYNTRDELWSIDNDEFSRKTTFRVYKVTGEEQMGTPGFTQVYSRQSGVSWPFEVVSSDYRASDVGDRHLTQHNSNAAVVMYHEREQMEQAEVVMHDGSGLVTVNPPDLGETASTMFFCVGEDNYSSSELTATSGNTGVIGRSDMRILWCGDSSTAGGRQERRVWILGRNSSGNGLSSVISNPLVLPDGLFPAGAVWGYFWSGTFPHRQSGFILYDNAGNYAVVYTKNQNNWKVSPLYRGLFGNGTNPGAVIAYRETVWPATAYSPSKDVLCALVNTPMIMVMSLCWSSGDGDTMEMGVDADEVLLCEANASDYTSLSFQHGWNMNRTRFFFGGDGVTTYYTRSEKHFPTQPGGSGGWSGESDVDLYSTSSWGVVSSPMRVRHTRRAYASALMPRLNDDLISIRKGAIRGDNGMETGEAAYSSTESYLNNMCSPTCDYSASANGAFDLEFEWGVNQTTEDNCLFANIQAFGKYPMLAASFPPSHDTGQEESDTLLYLTVAPIVHGCRGISFYALDMALQSGPIARNTAVVAYRAPAALLNWGPSRDCEENVDMVSRVHSVVRMLTGKKGGPDFLNALVDHSNYEVLDDTEAYNALWSSESGYIPYPDDEYLNFIALQEKNDGNILLLISYDGDVKGYSAPSIAFPNRIASAYGPPECWGGYCWSWMDTVTEGLNMDNAVTRCAATENAAINQKRLGVYIGDMPPHTVCLLRIPRNRNNSTISGAEVSPQFQTSRSSEGIVLQLTGCSSDCSLGLYDIDGRKADGIEIQETEDYEVLLNTDSYSAGMYFAVLREKADAVQMEKISIF
jgi:hypothetical protein